MGWIPPPDGSKEDSNRSVVRMPSGNTYSCICRSSKCSCPCGGRGRFSPPPGGTEVQGPRSFGPKGTVLSSRDHQQLPALDLRRFVKIDGIVEPEDTFPVDEDFGGI